LLAILEENLANEVSLTPEELLAEVRKFDLKTRGESAKIISQDRMRKAGLNLLNTNH
jgi:hypothetical protein